MSQFLISAGVFIIMFVGWLKIRDHYARKDMKSIDTFYKKYVPKEHWPEHMKEDK